MAIVGEDGTGVTGAEAYGDDPIALIGAYWSARPHDPLSDAWGDGDLATATKEGAARAATAYIDATWGPFYIGYRASQTQGLLWPRVAGKDDDGDPVALTDGLGNELPALPPQLVMAMAELAARALSGPLAEDAARGGRVKRTSEAVGPLKEEVEYFDGAPAETRYGVVLGILAPVLNGSQPGAGYPTWFWR